jgi:hypothetical protein
MSRFIGNHNSHMLPTAQLNLLPLAQLILLKQTVDAASEQWEREQAERKKGTEKTTAVFADNTYTRRVYDKASTEDIGLLQSRIENTGTSDQITHSCYRSN